MMGDFFFVITIIAQNVLSDVCIGPVKSGILMFL